MTALCSPIRHVARRLALVALTGVVLHPAASYAQSPPESPLGSARSFAVLGAASVTNTGATVLTGDLGVSPGTVITGFPPGAVVAGTIHAGDPVATQALADARIANTEFMAMPCAPVDNLTGQILGMQVDSLAPGVYCFNTSAQLTGTLTLTGAGPWIFKIGSTLTSASNAAVVVANAGSTCGGHNVFWQVGSSATIGVGTRFAGTILAEASATIMTGASVSGSVVALTATVALDSNAVSVCDVVTPANQSPVANAGPDQAVSLGSDVTLDGSGSTDDGQLQPLSYEWTSDTGFSRAGQVATVSLPVGTHVFTLTVNDGELSATDSVTITVTPVIPANQVPIANAGPDQVVPSGSGVTLDGSSSTDDGQLQPLSYAWVSDTGVSAAGQVATVSLPVGTHVFTLTVYDGALSATDSVTITVAASPQSPLGSAQSFAVLGASIVTNIGPTVVTGDMGVSPGTVITGFPPGVVVGTIHAGDTVAAQAQADAAIANTALAAMTCTTHLTGQDLGAVGPLPAGVYCFDTSAQLTGTLFLTGAGPWIFQIGSTLTTASNAAVMVDAGTACRGANVFWQVGTSATLGTFTQFAGTILAGASITVMTGASVSGRALALIGAVTLDSNAVSVCDAVTPANQSPVANAGPDQAVPSGSGVTLDGSGSTDDGQLQPLSYAWVSDTGVSAAGQVATVSLPVGTHVFTLTVYDGEFSATDSVTITVTDAAAPAIAIAAPVADAAYAVDQLVFAWYACTDPSGIASCTGTAASGAPIDTSSAGSRTFCVTAVDSAGNGATRCVFYSVLEPPTITVTSPIEPIYELGALLLVEYACTAGATCAGDVASGSALDTSTPGLESFTITSTDAAGNTTTQVVTYMVSLGSCVAPFAGLTAWLPGDNSAVERVTDTAAIWTGTGAYQSGKVAQAFSVGSGGHLSLPFRQEGAFTLQAWVRAPDRLLPEFTGVLSTGAPAQSATSFQIELDGTGNYRLNVGDSALSWPIGPALDHFQHVAVTFDGSTLTTYLNGQLVQGEVWAGSPGLGFHVLNVGIDRDGVRAFTGLVDEVQVFNRALSEAEVAQTFLTGASGLCNNRPPEAVAAAAPNPAEATGPDGAIVTLDGTGSSDPDPDTLICTWHEGATLLGTGCLLSIPLSIGTHGITLTVDDGQGETDTADVVVVVQDTTGPALTVPQVVFAEATGPLGAIVFYTASATDAVTGAAAITCAPASGSGFAIGSTLVTCSAADATGNSTSVTFDVIVRDTIAPEVRITSSADAPLSGSTFLVVVQASDIVGVVSVTVNGVEATRTTGSAQAGTWVAAVPISLPVQPGGVLRFEARASDAAGNVATAILLIDNDGIPAAMDRNRLTGADESGIYSSDFVNGPTAGTLTRNGWTVKLSSSPTAGGVRVTISGSGGIARISACTGTAKEVRLDAIGETADLTCAPTGTITVKAISAAIQIELREHLATGAWQQFNLRTGQSMSVGSPATASLQNLEPIDVHLVQIDGAGLEIVVGSYQLRPGASVDVAASPRRPGRDGRLRFKVLAGSVSVTVSGRMRTLKAGQETTMPIERRSPVRPLPAR